MSPAEAESPGIQGALALSMLQQAAMHRVLSATRQLGLECIFLKGSALAYWLYDKAEDRECGDVDVLVASYEEAEVLARQLADNGMGRAYEPSGYTAFERLVRLDVKPGCMVEIDIHWGLVNAPVFAKAFDFEELRANSFALTKVHAQALALKPPHALLHACLHLGMSRVLSDFVQDKWLIDIRHLIEAMSGEQKCQFADLALEKRFCGLCLFAIDQAQQKFGWRCDTALVARLQQGRANDVAGPGCLHSPLAMFRANWAAWPQSRWRWRWLLERLFPRLDYLRLLYDRPLASRFSLLMHRAGAMVRLVLSPDREK